MAKKKKQEKQEIQYAPVLYQPITETIEKNYMPIIRPIIAQVYGPQTRLFYAIPKPEVGSVTAADQHRA